VGVKYSCVNIFFHWVELIGAPPAVHPEVHPTGARHSLILKHKHPGRKLVVTDALKAILRDCLALIRLAGRRPTHVTELVEHPPAYQGFVEASKWGVGGVWFGGTKQLIPIVWFYKWPQTIREQFCLASKKNWGTRNIGPGTNRHTPLVACPRTYGWNVNTPQCKHLNMVRRPTGSSMDVQVQNLHLTCGSTNPPGPSRQTTYKRSSVIVCQTHFRYL
jgi:hypothetical protein